MLWYQRWLFYALFGVFTEVIFTSLKTFYYHQDFMLHGNTQLWVILVYGFGGIVFEKIYRQIKNGYNRIGIYLAVLYCWEYSCGWFLQWLLGVCPWHYHEPGNIHGLVQLWYIPLWLFFVSVANQGIYFALNYDLVKATRKNNKIIDT